MLVNVQRSEWLHNLLSDIYLSSALARPKTLLLHEYEDYLAPLLERQLFDRHIRLNAKEASDLAEVNNFLGYLDRLVELSQYGLLSKRERQTVFEQWPNSIASNDTFSALRRYIALSGYKTLASELELEDNEYVVFYGSSMKGLNPKHQPDFSSSLKFVGKVLLPGHLYVVEGGTYDCPGIVLEDLDSRRFKQGTESLSLKADKQRKAAAVQAELYSVKDVKVFADLDRWEDYNAGDIDGSPYVRRSVRTLEPKVDAWVYVGNHSDKSRVVKTNSWRKYLAGKG